MSREPDHTPESGAPVNSDVSAVSEATPPTVRLQISAAKKLNLADFQNAVPVLHELVIVNGTSTPISELSVHLVSEPPFVKPRAWNVELVAAGESYHLSDLDVQLDGALFSRLTEAELASLHLDLRSRQQGNEVIAHLDCAVELLPRNQWGGIDYLPEMLAAFVQPNDPAIDRLLKGAALALQAGGKSGSIDGYTHGLKRAWELASGIWAAVLQRKLNYALPPANFEHIGQKIRSPTQVIDGGLATCLDLALLFAACLEQAHLNPLLVCTRGHAFVGVWLRDEEFSTSVVDDITAVRNRLKLQEMLVFESTLAAQGQAVGFSRAIAHANRQLSEEEQEKKENKFQLVIDVKRARRSRIKPLAQAQAVADAMPVEVEPETAIGVEDAPDLPDEAITDTSLSELDPNDRLARWQRKLLDLSLRNTLLNFKQGKKALLLEVPAPALEDTLAQGQAIKLLPSPLLMQGSDPRSQQLHEARSLEDLPKAHALDALKRREVFIKLENRELEERLVELYRGARNAMQEGGSNTLFIALGFLVWTRPDKPESQVKAPLILLPITLNRKSARSGFSLQDHEDDALLNPTLVEMLRQDFQLELGIVAGALPRDESGLDIVSIWNRVRSAIKDINGWEVSEDVVLSMFSFAKYLMWKDLSDRTADLRQSPVVAHLLDTPREPYPSSTPFPETSRLDADYTPQQVFSPLPADSSQLSAVMAAARGKDFVLIGPPGTGKSQTIANLIAQCLAENKRVLFVAEKIAALDVVYRRLRDVGLGEFCLELHSNKSRKLDVLGQLQKSWESQGVVDVATWEAKASQLGQVREQLSTYVARLHHRHNNGWTIFKAIGCVVGGDALPDLRFSWASPRAHDEAALVELRVLAGRLQANAAAVNPDQLLTGALVPVYVTDWSAKWQQKMVRSAQTLQTICLDFQAAAQTLGHLLGMEWPALHLQARSALGVLAQALPQAADQDWSFCALPDAERICAALKTGNELLGQHREISSQMSPPWTADLQTRMHHALDLLDKYRKMHAELGTPWPPDVSTEIEHGVQLIEEINQLRASLSVKYGAAVGQINVSQLHRDWVKAEKAFQPMSWLGKRKVRKVLEGFIEGAGEPRVADDLSALVRIKSLHENVQQLNPGSAAEGLWTGIKTRVDHARSALKANTALQAARMHKPFTLDGLDAASEGCCGERWTREVQRLKFLLDLDNHLTEYASLTECSLGLWQGHNTDSEALRLALAFERERLTLQQRGLLQTPHLGVAEGRCGSDLQQQHEWLQRRGNVEARLLNMTALASDCPDVWKALDTDSASIERALKFHALLKTALGSLGFDSSANAAALRAVHQVLATRRCELGESGAISQACLKVASTLPHLSSAAEQFFHNAEQPDAVRRMFANHTPVELAETSAQLDAHHHGLHAWCAWRHAQHDARNAGLGALVDAIDTGDVTPAQAPTAFEVNYARWWLAEAVDEDDVLKRFVCAEHELRIQEFRALDDEFTQVTRAWIRAKLCANLPASDSIQRNSQWGILRHEITKKKKHKPLRQLLQEIPSVVLRLTPCLLMSPLSIAQYLSAEAKNFDLVVFDEASQIPVWDAIGAMARGKQVVMVGDPKQLPPTNFFGRSDGSDDDDGVVEGDLESILDECLGASLPMCNLTWHYRSRHESLIAFSNNRYYGGGLVTFPSPVTDDQAVSFNPVKGIYEKGGARINQPEAKALVADLVSRLKSLGFRESGLTIGVVTFNSEQQTLIENMLDAERRKDPSLEPYFSETELEPVFVKNLESVQGDERDIMYFSITYGPDMTGAVSMNFGPLNRDGGERRLNVAVTRARHELRVYSSLRGDQMDLSRTKASGVRDLKHFLEFAEYGPRALAEAHRGSQGDFESPFEASVAASLERKGWQVHAQIGASKFRVDLGVVHPDFAGRYLAGLECDGATYHRSATARDRDKLREQVLQGLGWKIVRIWSTDWWVNPGGTLERVHAALAKLLKEDRVHQTRMEAVSPNAVALAPSDAEGKLRLDVAEVADAAPICTAAFMPTQAVEHQPKAVDAFSKAVCALPVSSPSMLGLWAADTKNERRYQASQPCDAVGAAGLSANFFHEPSYAAVLQPMVEWVVQHEGPVLDAVLARRIARAHGFQRTGSRIQERVEQIARRLFRTTVEAAGTFYWPHGVDLSSEFAFRQPSDEDSVRGVEEICEAELRSLTRLVLHRGHSGQDALLAMARALGIQRLREASKVRLEALLIKAFAPSQQEKWLTERDPPDSLT